MPHDLIHNLSETWEVIALGLSGGRGTFEALSPTWRALLVIAAAVAVGFVLQNAFQNWRGVPAQIAVERERVDSIAEHHRVLIDSIDVASMRRSDGNREAVREIRDMTVRTQAVLDDLVCVLSAQAQARDPQVECRDPLPLVPR